MDNELALELSLEQEFSLIQHEKQVASLSQAQAQELLIESL
jgi:Phycobilisome degradation protein nblA